MTNLIPPTRQQVVDDKAKERGLLDDKSIVIKDARAEVTLVGIDS